jgi:hypothetical protein
MLISQSAVSKSMATISPVCRNYGLDGYHRCGVTKAKFKVSLDLSQSIRKLYSMLAAWANAIHGEGNGG